MHGLIWRRIQSNGGFLIGVGAAIAACAEGTGSDIVNPGGHGPYLTDSDGGLVQPDAGDAKVVKDAPGAPGNGAQCAICYKDSDCTTAHRCVASAYGDKFCAAPCSGTCKEAGMECVSLAYYPPVLGDGGAPDASAGGAEAGVSSGFCVPASGASCPCTALREGVSRNCVQTNSFGTCKGSQLCSSSAWKPCDAPVPEKEICDGKDNNCNGLVDTQETGLTAADLCGSGTAPHATFACTAGKCVLGECEAGWTRYPPGIPESEGCPCEVDKTDLPPKSDNVCNSGSDKGSLSDVGSASVTVTGTLSSDTDEDWFFFTTTDTKQNPGANTYRIHIEFAGTGNPGDEYRLDVLRGAPGSKCQGTTKTTITTYDWCATDKADDSCAGVYALRVYRKTGATASCKPYTVNIKNGGSGACPAADQCGKD